MILFKKITDWQKWVENQSSSNRIIGFVPTMGALHTGHISLIEAAKKENKITICSIFVNPTQFNDPKDFAKYPVTIEKDIRMLEEAGCDILFLPSVNEIYPDGLKETVHYDLGFLESLLEGKFRPGHFQGVCRVVHRLLDITQPDNLYLGQKDYQQCMVIARLVELMNPEKPIHINIRPTLREKDGLAMSSRNMRLNEEERKKAPAIYQALTYIKDHIKPGSTHNLKQHAVAMLEQNQFRVDYISIADAVTLAPADEWDGQQQLVALIAAFQGEVRLIDNMAIT